MKKQMLVDLFNSQAYIGHQRKYRTPQLQKYIYCRIHGIDIINLDFTIRQIENAINFLEQNKEKKLLVVSRRQTQCFLDNCLVSKIEKFKPGYISNFNYGKLDFIPDIIVIDKVADNHNLIKEASKEGVTMIGFCDTNTPFSLFSKINYPIVINDDSDKAIQYLLSHLI